MRYTTIIDISEIPALYRNHNVRLIYLHLCLRSGYHDHDRDLIDISIRGIAASVGVSISATRHALNLLQKAGLIHRQDEDWRVTKYVLTETPSRRPQTKREQQQEIERLKRQEEERKREAEDAEKRRIQAQWAQAMDAASKTFGMAPADIKAGAVNTRDKQLVIIVKGKAAATLIDDKDFQEFARGFVDQDYKIYPRIIK